MTDNSIHAAEFHDIEKFQNAHAISSEERRSQIGSCHEQNGIDKLHMPSGFQNLKRSSLSDEAPRCPETVGQDISIFRLRSPDQTSARREPTSLRSVACSLAHRCAYAPPPCMLHGEWFCRLLCCGYSCCLCRASRSDSDRGDTAAPSPPAFRLAPPSSVARQPRARPRETERFLGHATCAAALNSVLAKRQSRKLK
jgi:hypothetical protein